MRDPPGEHHRWWHNPQYAQQQIFAQRFPPKGIPHMFTFLFLAQPEGDQQKRSQQQRPEVQRRRFHAVARNFVGWILCGPEQVDQNKRRKIDPRAVLPLHVESLLSKPPSTTSTPPVI